jgi:hypothetical protein
MVDGLSDVSGVNKSGLSWPQARHFILSPTHFLTNQARVEHVENDPYLKSSRDFCAGIASP